MHALELFPPELWPLILASPQLTPFDLLALAGASRTLNVLVYQHLQLSGDRYQLPPAVFETQELYLTTYSLLAVHDENRNALARLIVCVLEPEVPVVTVPGQGETLRQDLCLCVRIIRRAVPLADFSLNLGCDIFDIARRMEAPRGQALLGALVDLLAAISRKISGPIFVIQSNAASSSSFMASSTEVPDWSLHELQHQFGRPTRLEQLRSVINPGGVPAGMTHARLYSGSLSLVPRITTLRYLSASIVPIDPGSSVDYGRFIAVLVFDPHRIKTLTLEPLPVTMGKTTISAERIASSVLGALQLPALREFSVNIGNGSAASGEGVRDEFFRGAIRRFRVQHPAANVRVAGW
ncbi:hypothetical protein C8F01DRAFT_750556 [Mycena amicta]|nr:hypothetical protein C8F01DRAFT_750556 [Mycena amicta]